MNRSSLYGAAGGYESAGGPGAARVKGEGGAEATDTPEKAQTTKAPIAGGSVISLSKIRTSRRDGTDGAEANAEGAVGSAADRAAEGAEVQESLGIMSSPGAGASRNSGAHTTVFTVVVEHHFPGVGRYSRLLSVSGAMSVADFADAILTSFDWPESVNRVPEAHPTRYVARAERGAGAASAADTGAADAPAADTATSADTTTDPTWSFRARTAGRVRVYAKGANSIGTALGDIFRRGTIGVLKVGRYDFSVNVTDTTTRHEEIELVPTSSPFDASFDAPGEPDAEAVLLAADFLADTEGDAAEAGGVNKNPEDELAAHLHPAGIPARVDVTEVNVALAGEDTVEQILAETDPELRELLHERALYEFIPLLQALDLERPANVTEHAAELLADAPIEKSKIGRAAAWARIIALSTLVDSEVDEVSEAFMSALGFTRADAKLPPTDTALGTDALSASEIKWLSRRTGRILAQVGACKWEPQPDDQAVPLVPQCSLLDRLEMYRFVLQR
ncbi:hypothetical protein COJE103337_06605 [Corynebacterium jeikeium]|uniref:Uncharacterized protein n=2 Tax=Corynebacterium jeikeium TaxID=38289 RepID=Q4JSH9_CORJK|nr:hypothetical protein [Corynebacterium jeikeium]WCZ54700.1 hypothetical protein CJEIK_11095 [Corynebacterium jeikeium]CAI38228.1 hypothetical protein jk2046 [Corynebacterium jeikeium K411]SUY82198.1 Uncharacterised protein [Corynebacterium jeikeium]SUY84420.1 Uncharacterised protein [Corynebacterium jeikeium]